MLCAILLIFTMPPTVRADATDGPSVKIAPAPDWVKPIDADSVALPKSNQVQNGIDYILVDTQQLVEPRSSFHHYAQRVVNEHGLQDASEIDTTYDPSYQDFAFHWLRVKRNGAWQDRLPTDKFQVMRREESLDSQLLDGRFSVVCHLQDIRVGDEIDYAYTVTGANPVFGGKFVDSFSTTWGSPVHLFRHQLTVPAGRHVACKSFACALQPSETPHPDGSTLLTWMSTEVPAVYQDDNTPGWYDTFGWVQLSEFTSWKEVADWGVQTYQPDAPLSPELQEKVAEIARHSPTPEDRALGAIRFVQDDIRYLGVEMGANSYKPNLPAVVCQHRFGDCKDKALLCVAMLRALGIEANPVIVSTEYRQELDRFLPSPLAFDHSVVQLILDGHTYWIDATRDGQRGRLRHLYIGDYKRALVIQPGVDALVPMGPTPESLPQQVVQDDFIATSVKDPMTLKVHTVDRGLSAEYARRNFAETSLDKIEKDYLKYYAGHYPKIKSTQPVRFQDFPEENRFEVWEEYSIPHYWDRETPDSAWKALFTPYLVSDAIGQAPSPERSSPYQLDYPSDVTENMQIQLWENWPISDPPHDITTPHFLLTDRPSADHHVVRFNYHYQALAPNVAPDAIADYHDQVKKLQNTLAYRLTWKEAALKPPAPAPFRLNGMAVAILLMVFAATCYVAYRLYPGPRDPSSPAPAPNPPDLAMFDGVRGWLFLVSLGLFARVIQCGIALGTNYGSVWDSNQWNVLTVPGGASYDPLWAPTLLFEAAYYIVVFVFSIFCLVIMFQKRAIFPKVIIALLLFTLAFQIADIALAWQIPLVAKQNNNEVPPDLIRVLVQALIWVPYFLISRRVKATFRH